MAADPSNVLCEGHAIRSFMTLINKRLYSSETKREHLSCLLNAFASLVYIDLINFFRDFTLGENMKPCVVFQVSIRGLSAANHTSKDSELNRLYSFFRGFWPGEVEQEEQEAPDVVADAARACEGEEGEEEQEEDDPYVEADMENPEDGNPDDDYDDQDLAFRLGACPDSPAKSAPAVRQQPEAPKQQPEAPKHQPQALKQHPQALKPPEFATESTSESRADRQARIALLRPLAFMAFAGLFLGWSFFGIPRFASTNSKSVKALLLEVPNCQDEGQEA